MLHTDEHVIVPFTVRSLLGFALVLIVITAPLWWRRTHALAAASRPDLRGEWVGDAMMTGYVAGLASSTPMHQPAVLYLNLVSYDSVLHKVQGQGQLMVAGETQPRPVHIVTLGPAKPDGRVDGEISGDLYRPDTAQSLRAPEAARVVQGRVDGGVLALHTIDDSSTIGYVFQSSLQHGTHQDFAQRCQHLGTAAR